MKAPAHTDSSLTFKWEQLPKSWPKSECIRNHVIHWICLRTFMATCKTVWLIYIHFTILQRKCQIIWKIQYNFISCWMNADKKTKSWNLRSTWFTCKKQMLTCKRGLPNSCLHFSQENLCNGGSQFPDFSWLTQTSEEILKL